MRSNSEIEDGLARAAAKLPWPVRFFVGLWVISALLLVLVPDALAGLPGAAKALFFLPLLPVLGLIFYVQLRGVSKIFGRSQKSGESIDG